MNPSPRAHLYRVLVLLAVALGGLFFLKGLAVPASWDAEKWYRVDALEDLKEQELVLGGNTSCSGSSCHEDAKPSSHQLRYATMQGGSHSGLACEVCHGALAQHAKAGEVVGHAQINPTIDLCMSCHAALVTRPSQFPQFKETHIPHALLGVKENTVCRTCHDPHDPN